MDLLDPLVGDQMGADLGAAVDHLEPVLADQAAQRPADEGPQILVHRVHLEHAGPVLHEELVQHVGGTDRGDVAGSQDQRHAAFHPRLPISGRLVRGQVVAADRPVQPHLGAEAGEEQPIGEPIGEHPGRQPPVAALLERPRRQAGRAAVADLGQRPLQAAHIAHHGHRSGQPLLSGRRAAGVELLGADRRRDPILRHLHHPLDHLLQEVDAAVGGERGEATLGLLQPGDDPVELDERGGGRRGLRLGRHRRPPVEDLKCGRLAAYHRTLSDQGLRELRGRTAIATRRRR